MYVHGVSSSHFLHTSTHTLCTESVHVNLLPFPPHLSPFLSPSSSPPSHSHLQPASTISSLHQKEWGRASHRGRGEGPADRIWSSSACGENDLEDSETESGMGTRRLEYPLFSRHWFLPWNKEGEKKEKKKKHSLNSQKSKWKKIERREMRAEDKKMYSGPLPWTLGYGSLLLLPSLPWTP